MKPPAFDNEIAAILESTYEQGSKMKSPYNSDQLRMAITAMNMRAMVNTLLAGDANPDFQVNFKKLALGLLGTVDFLERTLPDIGGGLEDGIAG